MTIYDLIATLVSVRIGASVLHDPDVHQCMEFVLDLTDQFHEIKGHELYTETIGYRLSNGEQINLRVLVSKKVKSYGKQQTTIMDAIKMISQTAEAVLIISELWVHQRPRLTPFLGSACDT